jgi:predicted CXXCH cytochrome family protein
MARRRNVIVLTAVALVGLVVMTVAASGVPQPDIPRGQGEHCVEDTDFMRRNHMTLLKHQRDETVLKGVRTKQHSLKECVSCHAVHGPDAMPVTVSSPKHFCRSCHDYAAVTIDCFQCHASRPEVAAADESE